ncbi:FIG4 [Bugula neritina]|uniref:FIG4 n=1 Tax=Bugula neritina TaxID=10212 RepID=A0A7J7J2B0_BUGNE|nr:FIG4 [Bugula neritina]
MALAFRNFANIVQKITVYETKETLYVLGSDEAENVFRLLEINRNDRKELMIHEVQKEYTAKETKEYFHKVQQNDKRKYSSKSSFNKIASGHALAGFVRFMEGYYLILVTQRVKVAKIGSHVIYRVQGTNMIYIPGNSATHPDESRYLKLFESVDLSNNFYFSYTYDLTHTLQYNQIQMEETSLPNFSAEQGKIEGRQQPLEQFVWNDYLIQPMKSQVHNDWILYFVHGFLSQLNMIVFGQQIYITLISRRSNKYAGTRFLKRGCNSKGYVANEVETEQIVHDASQTSFNGGAYTSFVQMRGSIPLYWSQDLTKAMSKPPISLDFTDPYGGITAPHFERLLKKYGAPIIILNLVKVTLEFVANEL